MADGQTENAGPFDNVDPTKPASTQPSRTEIELDALEKRRAELLAQKAAEDAVKLNASRPVRVLAIGLHSRLCPSDHPSLACTFFTDPFAEDPDAANWTEPAHARWLGVAQLGVGLMKAAGWTVAEPPAP